MCATPEDGTSETQGRADPFIAEVAACIAEYDQAVLFREVVADAVAGMAAGVADMTTFDRPPAD